MIVAINKEVFEKKSNKVVILQEVDKKNDTGTLMIIHLCDVLKINLIKEEHNLYKLNIYNKNNILMVSYGSCDKEKMIKE